MYTMALGDGLLH